MPPSHLNSISTLLSWQHSLQNFSVLNHQKGMLYHIYMNLVPSKSVVTDVWNLNFFCVNRATHASFVFYNLQGHSKPLHYFSHLLHISGNVKLVSQDTVPSWESSSILKQNQHIWFCTSIYKCSCPMTLLRLLIRK